ncbi:MULTISPECIES: mechanosensitive ion channel family protein [Mesonia]|jgi:small conductance mechanosensitive channel|uniref:Small conductance mechanosensitive channel n=1 Tax=Mesonia algae TaxID=213248 RepID=A0A2W7I616_9FLAO|nr:MULTISPECIES: mechanosensitive ion channel domain-containing protein [Mesonia]PZW41679.1 small conductance mechanosensitive channel [Mesonia algae]TXK75727.1 mechanosensitive ion channel [Mesonia sp. K4-1]|tara:strand:- start:359 stop:1183 length:825 start_codon:yes stop_codon:yes gene_type:complete
MEKLDNIEYYAKEYGQKLIDFLPNLVAAIAILVIGWWIAKIIVRYVKKFFQKKSYDPALENFIVNILGWALKILVFITAITQLGIETTSLVAIIGAAGLAIGLALQGSLANFAGGVLIIILKPFKIGDWIEAQGVSGSVKEISIFYTHINTFGNQLAVIPNGQLSNDNIINYTVEGKRKDAITIGISYDANIKEAKDILLNLMKEQEGIHKDPEPQVVVTELADNSVNLSLRFWASNDEFWGCHWYTIEEAKRRLDAAGIGIPYPQRDVHIIKD